MDKWRNKTKGYTTAVDNCSSMDDQTSTSMIKIITLKGISEFLESNYFITLIWLNMVTRDQSGNAKI